MNKENVASIAMQAARKGLISAAIFQLAIGNAFAGTPPDKNFPYRDNDTATPIKHVIVIIGENRTFDHIFATYVPPKKGETVFNLLSEGIVKADGTPGQKFYKAQQLAGSDKAPDDFLLNPVKTELPNATLPAPLVGGPKTSYISGDSIALAKASENGLPADYYTDLVSGGTGQTKYTPDQRITNVNSLPAGPFQLTNGSSFSYDSYAASPVHRFYQMWQQLDCSLYHSSTDNPSGCDSKLFSWVEVTVGAGANGSRSRRTSAPSIRPQPTPPAKAPLRWASITSSRATPLISSTWPTPIR